MIEVDGAESDGSSSEFLMQLNGKILVNESMVKEL